MDKRAGGGLFPERSHTEATRRRKDPPPPQKKEDATEMSVKFPRTCECRYVNNPRDDAAE